MFRTFPRCAFAAAPLLLACGGPDRWPSKVTTVVDASTPASTDAPVADSGPMLPSGPAPIADAGRDMGASTAVSDAGASGNVDASSLPASMDAASPADAEAADASTDASPVVGESDLLFDPTIVRRVDLRIPTDDGPPSTWELIDEQARLRQCETKERQYYLGAVTIDGAEFADVGIKTKGGCGSSVSLEQKASFKIHLSWDSDPTDQICPATRRYLGRKRLTLNNGRQDNTALHEHLTYQFYRMAGVPAPKTAAAQVYVNDEYYGLYQLVEGIDRDFIDRRFAAGDGKGMMYEGAYWCDLLTGDGDPLADGGCWEREFELDACSVPAPGDDLQWHEEDGVTPQDPWKFARALQDNVAAIAAPDAYYPAIRQWVAWDEFLVYWATSIVVVDWDNYINLQNNFRFYHDTGSDLWHWIPWGVDQTWRSPDTLIASLSHHPFEPRGDLARLCLEATGTDASGRTCTQAYVTALWDAVALFESVDWSAEIDAWQVRLTPYMQLEEDKRSYSYEAWLENVDSVREFAATRALELATQLTDAGYPRPE